MYSFNQPDQGFSWDVLGDVAEGRKTLGQDMSVYTYRLLQFALKKILTDEMGHEKAQDIFRKAGILGGRSFAAHFLDRTLPFNEYVVQLQKTLVAERIGILQIERYNPATLNMTITVSEDLDCSGLPVSGEAVCDYDEGFIAGILLNYDEKIFDVHAVDCWASGGRVCRFSVKPRQAATTDPTI